MTTNQELWDAVIGNLSLDEGYTIGISPGQLHLSAPTRWVYVRNPGDVTTWSVETAGTGDDTLTGKRIRIVADADTAVQMAKNFVTGAGDHPPFQVELVWNRERDFVPRGVPLSTLETAKQYALALLDMGDGARVKKVRIIDANGSVAWSYG